MSGKGALLLYFGNYTGSILLFNKVLKIDPNNKNAFNNIGRAYSILGNQLEAIKYYDKALTIDPNLKEFPK